jgi:hypothetical protein
MDFPSGPTGIERIEKTIYSQYYSYGVESQGKILYHHYLTVRER